MWGIINKNWVLEITSCYVNILHEYGIILNPLICILPIQQFLIASQNIYMKLLKVKHIYCSANVHDLLIYRLERRLWVGQMIN